MERTRCRAWAERYIELCNTRRYLDLADLFADGCIYLNHGAKRILRDPKEIAAFYDEFLTPIEPHSRIGFWVEDGDRCAFELEASIAGRPEVRLGAMDSVTLGPDGRAIRFAAFPFGDLDSWE